VAASSKTAARRKKKKALRRQAWQAAFEAEWAGHAEEVAAAAAAAAQQYPMQQEEHQQQQQNDASGLAAPAGPQEGSPEGPAAAAAEGPDHMEEGSEQGEEEEGEEEEEEGTASEENHDDFVLLEDVVETAEDTHSLADSASAAGGEPGGAAPGPSPSSVAIITQDFAMQNVLLQMGLRLLTRAGQAVTRLRRWALRCPACYGVTKEAGRLFCPKCGNLGLERVEVRVGRGGAEVYGVSKRHVLRGTKYSLPKPRVGGGWEGVGGQGQGRLAGEQDAEVEGQAGWLWAGGAGCSGCYSAVLALQLYCRTAAGVSTITVTGCHQPGVHTCPRQWVSAHYRVQLLLHTAQPC
jgi:RNA-binding protein NOB1